MSIAPTREVSLKCGSPKVIDSIDIEDAIDEVGMGRGQWLFFVICGLFIAADSVEVFFLSFVVETLRKPWGLDSAKGSLLMSMVFLGQFFGAPVWGWMADKYGRRPAFLLCSLLVSVSGILTSQCDSFSSLVLVRVAVGFGISGNSVPFDILAESLPAPVRGKVLMSTSFWWTAGALYSIVAAWLSLSSLGWRWFTVICSAPSIVAVLLGAVMLPESAHWLASEGREKEAAIMLNDLAQMNGAAVLFKEVTVKPVLGDLDTFSLFSHGKLRRPFFLMIIVWISFGLSYYGLTMLIPRIFAREIADEPDAVDFDFVDIALSSAAQTVGIFVGMLLIDSAGRKGVQVGGYVLAGVATVGLGFRDLGFTMLTLLSSVAVGAAAAASCATWVHTPELFPTKVRGVAHSLLNASARVGAFFAPYAVSDLISDLDSALFITIGCLVAAAAVSCLMETAGLSIDNEDVDTTDSEDGL